MPVTLPPAESPEPRPSPPRFVVWLFLMIVVVAIGVISTLLTWPKSEPTGTVWFWVRLLVIPPLGWAVALGLRSFYYEQECARIEADNEALWNDREKALQFASDPLAVAGCSYLTGAGSGDLASVLSQGAGTLEARTSADGSNAVRHSALTLTCDDEDPDRYRACFQNLIDSVAETVRAIPHDVPFGVRLQLPDDVDHEALLKTWQVCWKDKRLRVAKAALLPTDMGVMALDEWLDNRGGLTLERFLLFVVVQLHVKPPQNSAEAAVALVLGWAPLARRRYIKSIALLHRPVESESDKTNAALSTALQWGRTTSDKVKDLWQVGLQHAEKTTISRSLSDLSIGVSETENLSGIHDIDTAIGYPGNAAGWLAIALGIEHAAQNNNPQLVAWRERSLRFAVVQPVG
jgi:hypothetical protein